MPETLAAPVQRRCAQSGKYLTFRLGEEQFAVEILKVREIIGLMTITQVPGAPSAIRGVINLRGKIIPVMSLRSRFKLPEAEAHDRNCIVVTEVESHGETLEMGLLVDMVSEVLFIAENEIEPPPSFGETVDTSYILGMAKTGPDVKILLDIDQVVCEHGPLINQQAD